MPNKIGGLGEMETKLASTNFDEIMNDMTMTYINLTMPKFKIEHSVNLLPVCNKVSIYVSLLSIWRV